jgi:hypothetical protein
MLDISKVREGNKIEYLGESLAYGGNYIVVSAESTYTIPNNCPEEYKGKMMIIELMNDGTPLFIPIERLNAEEWKLTE